MNKRFYTPRDKYKEKSGTFATTADMTEKERYKHIRNEIIKKFGEEHILATINEDRIVEKKSNNYIILAKVWFELVEEYINDEEAQVAINFYFGKYSEDSLENIRFRIFEACRVYCQANFFKIGYAKQKFLEMVEGSYVIASDIATRILVDNDLFKNIEFKKGKE